MTTSHNFGPQLKARREQQGITIESISETTKIGVPLLEGLERGDVSHWPKGIFRRAFFRDYAAAIGAPVDDLLAEFLQLFPEDGRAGVEPRATGPLRMTLATVPTPVQKLTMRRIVAGVADATFVVLLGLIAAWALAVDRSLAVAVTGLLYYPLTTGWLGRSLTLSMLQRNRSTISDAWRTAPRGIEHRRATLAVAAEPTRDERPTTRFQRDRRTGKDRRRVPRLIHEPEPIANAFGMRKSAGPVTSPLVH
jgi:transcriptional regulator with XRE-family HTH domain